MATYDIYIDSNPARGNDSRTVAQAKLPATPWLSLHNANILNTLVTIGTDIYRFNIVDNGWTYPYRAVVDTFPIVPGYGAYNAEAANHVWNFNNAVITATELLTGVTWTKVEGREFVYVCKPGLSWTSQGCILAKGTGETWLGQEVIPFIEASNIPTDLMDHCYYYNATSDNLYICDWSGNPDDTGVTFEVGQKDYTCKVTTIGNHTFNQGRYFPGKEGCLYWNGGYTEWYRNKFFYGGRASVVRIASSTVLQNIDFAYNLVYGKEWTYTSGGMVMFEGDGTTGTPTALRFYNNLLYSGKTGMHFGAACGNTTPLEIKNNLFIDQSLRCLNFTDKNVKIVEDYNCYGISNYDNIATVTIGNVVTDGDWSASGANSIPAEVITSTTNVKVPDPMLSLFPLGNSPVKDTGVDVSLTEDINGNAVPAGAGVDIGAYEIQSTRRSYFYYNYA